MCVAKFISCLILSFSCNKLGDGKLLWLIVLGGMLGPSILSRSDRTESAGNFRLSKKATLIFDMGLKALVTVEERLPRFSHW